MYLFDTRNITKLDSNSFFLSGSLHNSDQECITFYLTPKCNDTLIPAFNFYFSGVAYYGETLTAPCLFNSIAITGNGCGPYINDTVHDNSCTAGSIVAVGYGGSGRYSYLWSTTDTTDSIGGLHSDSTYTVKVTDSITHCYVRDTFPLTHTDSINVAFVSDTISCSSNIDTIFPKVFENVGPITYLWEPGNDTMQDLTPALPGTYILKVTDSLGCTARDTITIPSDSLNMIISGPTTNCDTGFVIYSIAVPDINAYYHWTFKGANIDTITADSVKIKWVSLADTIIVTGIDMACHDTITIMLVIDSCCVPSDSATTIYALSDIAATAVSRGNGNGIVYQTLPYTPISGGYLVNGATISINGTFTVDENVDFKNCNVYMGPNAVIVVNPGDTFTLDTIIIVDTSFVTDPYSAGTPFDDTVFTPVPQGTSLSACSEIWQGIRLKEDATFNSNNAQVSDADSAVYVHGRATINATGTLFSRNFKGIVIDDDTGSAPYPMRLNGNSFSPIFANVLHQDSTIRTTLKPPYPPGTQSHMGVEITNVKNAVIGDSSYQRNSFSGMDIAINTANSGITANNNYIGTIRAIEYYAILSTAGADTVFPNPDSTVVFYDSVKVGIRATNNHDTTISSTVIPGPTLKLGTENMPSSIIIIGCDTGILVANFANSTLEIANDSIHSNDTTGYNIVIDSSNYGHDTAANYSTIYIHNNNIVGGIAAIYLNQNQTAANIDGNIISFASTASMKRQGIIFVDSSLLPISARDTIYGNELDSVYHGISDTFRYHPYIIENTITFATPTGSDTCTGISLYQSPRAGLGCNNITGYDASTEASGYGISCDSSTGTLMLYNQLNNLGVGIMNFHQQQLQLIDNVMYINAVGIGVSDTNATIGNQGGTSDTTYDNQWMGTFAVATLASYNSAERVTQDTFFVQSGYPYNPSGNIFVFTHANPILDTIIDTPKGYVIGSNCQSTPPLQLRTFWNGNNATQPISDTSVTQTSALDYKLIPNLFNDNFSATITLGANESGEVDIYNINGILIEKQIVTSGVNELNLSNPELVGGVYIYKVFVNGQIKTTDKLVVVH